MRASRPIRLLIVDDSAVARAVLGSMVSARPEFEVAGVAESADRALVLLESLRVDIVLLDLQMPGRDGLSALPLLVGKARGARVIVVSSSCGEGAESSVRALALGATDTLPKPGAGAHGGRFAEILCDRLLRLGHAPAAKAAAPPPPAWTLRAQPSGPVECLAIGASTGGVNALLEFFAALPGGFDAPILVTQHLPEAFIPVFAAQLAEMASRPATVARDGARLQRGEVLVAPGDAHISLIRIGGGVRVVLDRSPAASRCLPSVDPMLKAVGEVFRAGGVGVVLSGMGRDGATGARRLVERGGAVLVQDDATSVVWGMPGTVASAGLACLIAPPAEIARRIGMRAEAAA